MKMLSHKQNRYWFWIANLFISCWVAWWVTGCGLLSIKATSVIKGTVQDSAGHNIPEFKLQIVGSKPVAYTSRTEVEKYTVVTDQKGGFSQQVSWDDGITKYDVVALTPCYYADSCFNQPSKKAQCEVPYREDATFTIRVRWICR